MGSDLGDESETASFDLTYAPDLARPVEVRASSLRHIALAATADPSPSASLARRRVASGGVSAGSAVAKAATEIEAISPTTTTSLVGESKAEAKEATVASPNRSSSPVSVNLPLHLGSALRNLTGKGEQGEASWFDAPVGTCAHQTLPFGTLVKVTNVYDGTSTTCEVDDRGPFIDGRVIDLSYDVFEKLAHPGSGVIDVVIEW